MTAGTDGPDQGDPAAVVDDLVRAACDEEAARNGMTLALERLCKLREDLRAALRAPGAVAAAPPGDEDDATEAVLDMARAALLTDAPLSVRAAAQRVAVLIEVEGWRLAPSAGHEGEAAAPPGDECPDCDGTGEDREATGGRCGTCWHGRVPPTGHEDDAAVERAARVIYEERPTAALDWDETKSEVQDVYRGLARAALAAARGPRPVEDEAAAERAVDWRAVAGALMSVNRGGERITGTLDEFAASVTDVLAAARGPRTPDPRDPA